MYACAWSRAAVAALRLPTSRRSPFLAVPGAAMAAERVDAPMHLDNVVPSSEAARAPAAGATIASGGGCLAPLPEAVRAPAMDVAATWLNPGLPPSTLGISRDGTISYNSGPAHGLAARVAGGQLLMCFHHRGESHLVVPHLLHPVLCDGVPLTWRTHEWNEVLVLSAPLSEAAVPLLATDGRKDGLWFVPGSEPSVAELAPGGSATLHGSAALWGLAQSPAGGAARGQVLVLLVPSSRGEAPVMLRELAPGIWRCSAQRCVFVEDGAPCPFIQQPDLPRFVPRERLRHGLLWLHPGRAPQTVNLTVDGKVAWSEVGGLASGPANGKWELRVEDAQEYLSVNFNAFGKETRLRSVVLKRTAPTAVAWHTVGSVSPAGVLQLASPEQLADWHIVALLAQLPAKRPGL